MAKVTFTIHKAGKHQRHSRRNQILDAAQRCFKKQGFHKTTLRDIAQEFGMSAGHIYNYFSNKEAIIEALVELRTQEFLDMIDTDKFADLPPEERMDKELGQSLALILKKQGVKVFTNAMVQSVEKTGEDIAVNFTCKEKSETVSGEAVLCAIGRRPYCDGLFADGISVEMNRRSIAVNERYETSIPHIYAIGDVSAKIQLAHVATAQGIACVDLLYGRENHTSMSVVPSCIYCRPEIAVVGLTEAEAKEAGIPVKVGKHVMFDNAKTLIADPGRCFMKFVAHAETRELLGAQLMCEHASDMIGGVSQALANHMTVDQFLLAMRPHPSFEEAMTAALEDLAQKLG